jgi:outer membrane immunogenic protein
MMKKLLLATAATALVTTAASAADLPRRAAPPPVFTPVPVFTWTGFYAGLESAYTFTDRERITTAGVLPGNANNVALGRRPLLTSTSQDGIANIGGTAGYNYQFTPGSGIVVGIANSIDWTDITKNRVVLGNGNVAGGGMGGLAYGNVFHDANFYTPGGALQFAGRYDDFKTGFAYGGGIEFALPTDSFLNTFALGRYLGIKYDAITVKAEYLHYDLGSQSVLVAAIPGVGTGSYISRFRTEGSIVRAGFNYKFGGF